MLIIDVSPSMESTDVSPTRLEAAKEAGKQFADELTPGINLGAIAFGGSARLAAAGADRIALGRQGKPATNPDAPRARSPRRAAQRSKACRSRRPRSAHRVATSISTISTFRCLLQTTP